MRELNPCDEFDGLDPIIKEVEILKMGEFDAMEGVQCQQMLVACIDRIVHKANFVHFHSLMRGR